LTPACYSLGGHDDFQTLSTLHSRGIDLGELRRNPRYTFRKLLNPAAITGNSGKYVDGQTNLPLLQDVWPLETLVH